MTIVETDEFHRGLSSSWKAKPWIVRYYKTNTDVGRIQSYRGWNYYRSRSPVLVNGIMVPRYIRLLPGFMQTDKQGPFGRARISEILAMSD